MTADRILARLALAAAALIVFSLPAPGQSGRRIVSTPTPTPKPAAESAGYSESKPTQKRQLTALPAIRSVERNETKPKEAKPDGEVLSDADDDVIKVETNLITIPVSVFDRNGLYIPDLSKDNFKIFEDGREQEIAFFDFSEKPVTVVLLLDTSPSTEFKIDEIREAAVAFVNQLKAQDRVMVIEFDANINVLTEPTTDRQRIFRAIRKADFGNGTSLYDAVFFSLRKRLNAVEGRKAIVLFTDGVDTTSSRAGYDSSLREAEEADAVVFPIYYNTFFDGQRGSVNFPVIVRGTSRREYMVGREYLRELAEYTGGRVYNAENSPGGLTRTFESIAEELSRQYSIGYVPDSPGQPGQRKTIRVRVNRPNLVIRARDSYIVPAK